MNQAEESIESDKIKSNETSSFSYGSSAVGMWKFYVNLSKPLDEVQKDIDKGLKVLAYLRSKGYCIPNK